MNDEEIIKKEILQGLQQVDSSFTITEFHMALDNLTRNLIITFKAQTDSGETVSEVINYA